MNTNFFSQIAQLNIEGQLQLSITKGAGNNLIVAVMLGNEHCGDEAKNLITPFIIRETAHNLDEGFFQTIASPIEQASSLLNSMEAYMKQLEQAKTQSAMEKNKADAAKKVKDAKDKKYREAMATVDELDLEGKPREAWMKLPNLADYPDHKDAIRKRSSELSAKFSPDLFGSPTPKIPVAPPVMEVVEKPQQNNLHAPVHPSSNDDEELTYQDGFISEDSYDEDNDNY